MIRRGFHAHARFAEALHDQPSDHKSTSASPDPGTDSVGQHFNAHKNYSQQSDNGPFTNLSNQSVRAGIAQEIKSDRMSRSGVQSQIGSGLHEKRKICYLILVFQIFYLVKNIRTSVLRTGIVRQQQWKIARSIPPCHGIDPLCPQLKAERQQTSDFASLSQRKNPVQI
jgi:hypothetical protein